MEQEIIEKNKVIAEFMVGTVIPDRPTEPPYRPYGMDDEQWEELLLDAHILQDGWDNLYGKYHSDWSWIMPVVLRINSMPPSKGFFINEKFTGVHGLEWGGQSIKRTIVKNEVVNGDLLTSIYKSVYDFILWYNSQKETIKP